MTIPRWIINSVVFVLFIGIATWALCDNAMACRHLEHYIRPPFGITIGTMALSASVICLLRGLYWVLND